MRTQLLSAGVLIYSGNPKQLRKTDICWFVGVDIAVLPKIRSFETLQIASYGFKHIIFKEIPAPLTLGSTERLHKFSNLSRTECT